MGRDAFTRLMGLDVGSRRIGVALSDETGLIAQPHSTVQHEGKIGDTAERLVELALELEVKVVVIGLPRSLSGGAGGVSARRARNLGDQLEARGFEVAYWDERFTTAEAERVLVGAGVRRDARKRVVDKMAAALILQGYLDAQG